MHTNIHITLSFTIRTPQRGSSKRCHHVTAYNLPFNFQWKVVRKLLCVVEFVGEYEQTQANNLLILFILIIYPFPESKIIKFTSFTYIKRSASKKLINRDGRLSSL